MWKAITLVASTFLFSVVGTVAAYLTFTPQGNPAAGAIIGGIAGFGIGYLAVVIGVTSDKPK